MTETPDTRHQRFILTFGSGYPGICNGWVEVWAFTEDIARWWARRTYGQVWSGLYPADYFSPKSRAHYPLGKLGEAILWHDEVGDR